MNYNTPYNLEAEESVLGAVLLKPDSLVRVLDIVTKDDFYKPAHSKIYEAMLMCYERGELIDPVILINTIKKTGDINQIGGEDTIFSILRTVPTAANIENYARIVKEKSILRKLINAATTIIEKATEAKDEVDYILDSSENSIFRISQNRERKEVSHVKDLIDKELARLEEVYKNKGSVTGIGSGFKELDKLTSGFHNSDLVIIAARPSMGKTAFALNIAMNASLFQRKKVLIFNLEMSNSQIFQRFIAAGSHVSLSKLKNGFLDEEEWGRVGLTTGRLAESGIFVADTPSITVMEIRALARRLKSTHGLDMIIIDYMQLIKGGRGSDNRQQEISDISRALKGLARELDIPIISLSQLSRAPEQRADKRPMLADLRDSGAIEQDADSVFFLYRDEYYKEDSDLKGVAELRIGKQRNGPTGKVSLKFFSDFDKFTDYLPGEIE